MSYRAVIFDLGGVVLGSPLRAIRVFERDFGAPEGFVGRVILDTGPAGAWSRLERGEIGIEGFCTDFDRECSEAGHALPATEMMERIAASAEPRPAMLTAIRRIRRSGLPVAALTNNWKSESDATGALRPHFDVFVESSVVGWRKPDPRIYEHTCGALGVTAADAVFLDDIGHNLKAARALGMTTIKVVDPEPALEELSTLLALDLSEPG